MNLLIVEDNILFRGLLERILVPGHSLLPVRPRLHLTSSAPWTIPHE
jgi:hypothetical protein